MRTTLYMAKVAPVIQPSGTTLCNDFKSKPNIQVATKVGGLVINGMKVRIRIG
ncbi:hypothetical protein ABLB69_17325 [Xenorhabdus khoisanae]|uniref:hypothetical protein n=1 Tax=Xenorhabdus khoisanae TaxID=880157 RepID=UPI0032B7CF33